MDPIQEELVEEIIDYVHGTARDQIVAQLEQAGEGLGEVVASMSYRIVREAIDQLNENPVEIELVLGVATETIDMILEIADAMGIQYDPEAIREESLLAMVALHMEQVGDDPEQKRIAEEALQEMMADGTYEEAMGITRDMMVRQGVDPAAAADMGEQMVAGLMNNQPLA